MEFKFKGKVCSVEATSNGDECKYSITFTYVNTIIIGESEYGIAFFDEKNLKPLACNRSFVVDNKELFCFISDHSNDVLEITFDNTGNIYKLTKVKLSYE